MELKVLPKEVEAISSEEMREKHLSVVRKEPQGGGRKGRVQMGDKKPGVLFGAQGV